MAKLVREPADGGEAARRPGAPHLTHTDGKALATHRVTRHG